MILSEVQELYAVTEHLLSLSGPAARTIAENRRILRPHVQMFSERRDALIKKYADESGAVKQGSKNWDKFIKDFTDLLNWDIAISLKKLLFVISILPWNSLWRRLMYKKRQRPMQLPTMRQCRTCKNNEDLLCNRLGRLITDSDYCERWEALERTGTRESTGNKESAEKRS